MTRVWQELDTWRVESVASQQFAQARRLQRWNIEGDKGGINLETQDTSQKPSHDTTLMLL